MAGLPRRYLRTADADQLAAHVRLLSPPPADGELRCATRPGPVEDTVVRTVVAPDRRGLFADCAGVLAGHGAQVLEARAFTSRAPVMPLHRGEPPPRAVNEGERISLATANRSPQRHPTLRRAGVKRR